MNSQSCSTEMLLCDNIFLKKDMTTAASAGMADQSVAVHVVLTFGGECQTFYKSNTTPSGGGPPFHEWI